VTGTDEKAVKLSASLWAYTVEPMSVRPVAVNPGPCDAWKRDGESMGRDGTGQEGGGEAYVHTRRSSLVDGSQSAISAAAAAS